MQSQGLSPPEQGAGLCAPVGGLASTSQINPFPYLCATMMVVRWAQTLAREAWMFLSVSVSSADVACKGRHSMGKG